MSEHKTTYETKSPVSLINKKIKEGYTLDSLYSWKLKSGPYKGTLTYLVGFILPAEKIEDPFDEPDWPGHNR